MNNKILALADTLENSKQADLLEKFLNSVFDKGGLPYFVSDRPFRYNINSYMSSRSSACFSIKHS